MQKQTEREGNSGKLEITVLFFVWSADVRSCFMKAPIGAMLVRSCSGCSLRRDSSRSLDHRA